MTKLTIVRTVDNFDPTVAAVETITWVRNGIAYSIDLGLDNFARAEDDFGRYEQVAERLGPATVVINTDSGEEVIMKPRTRAKAKRQEPAQSTTSPNSANTPAETAFKPQLQDEFPTNKSDLYATKPGPGYRERERETRSYRMAMRNWLRSHGWPKLGNRGVVPYKAVDEYWNYIEKVRAERASST